MIAVISISDNHEKERIHSALFHTKQKAAREDSRCLIIPNLYAGVVLLSPKRVSSAQEDFTSVFGMRTGVAPPLMTPA